MRYNNELYKLIGHGITQEQLQQQVCDEQVRYKRSEITTYPIKITRATQIPYIIVTIT
jgi:hypothetical protein